MCFGGGGFDLFGSGGGFIGGLLGDILFPEIGIPATIAGAALGDFGGSLVGGKDIGDALIGGVTGGATAGIGSALGNVAGSLFSGAGDLFGGAASGAAGLGADAVGLGPGGVGSAGFSGAGAAAGGPAVSGVDLASSALPIGGDVGSAGFGGGGGLGAGAGGAGVGSDFIGSLTTPTGTSGAGTGLATLNQSVGTSLPTAATASAGEGGAIPNVMSSPSAGGGAGMDLNGGQIDFSGESPNSIWRGPRSGNFLTNMTGTTGDTGLGGSILNYLGNNPMTLLGGGMLGLQALMNPSGSPVPGSGPLNQNAAALSQFGNQTMEGLRTGQVPGGAQSILDQSKAAMDANTRSKFAGMGLSGSTMEGQALQQNAQTFEGQKWNIISDLLKQGTGALGQAGNINTELMHQQVAQDKELSDAIARFAASLAGGGMRSASSAA